MKFFVDTADVTAIRELNDLGMVDGVTTNPLSYSEVRPRYHRGYRARFARSWMARCLPKWWRWRRTP